MKAKILINISLALFIALTAFLASGARDADVVTELYEFPFKECPECKLWSGMLALPGGKRKLHYLFMKSITTTSATDPLVVVLHGGPGCSVLYTFLKGISPFIMPDRDTHIQLHLNPNTWVTFANVLVLEGVAGVGFSTATDQAWEDKSTAQDLFHGVKTFLADFPEYAKNHLFVAGEGYGGNLAALLAEQLIKMKEPTETLTLKGVILGNSVVDPNVQEESYFSFLHGHQIINLDLWEIISDVCPLDQTGPRCMFAKKTAIDNQDRLNPFDIYRYCSNPRQQKQAGEQLLPVESTLDCLDYNPLVDYFNRDDVKKNLHVDPQARFQYCSDTVVGRYTKEPHGVLAQVQYLLEQKIRVLAYTGDTNTFVSVQSTEAWIENLTEEFDLTVKENWYPYGTDEEVSKISGYATVYEQGLTFATIKGAGHFASQWKPEETAYVVSQFLVGEDP